MSERNDGHLLKCHNVNEENLIKAISEFAEVERSINDTFGYGGKKSKFLCVELKSKTEKLYVRDWMRLFKDLLKEDERPFKILETILLYYCPLFKAPLSSEVIVSIELKDKRTKRVIDRHNINGKFMNFVRLEPNITISSVDTSQIYLKMKREGLDIKRTYGFLYVRMEYKKLKFPISMKKGMTFSHPLNDYTPKETIGVQESVMDMFKDMQQKLKRTKECRVSKGKNQNKPCELEKGRNSSNLNQDVRKALELIKTRAKENVAEPHMMRNQEKHFIYKSKKNVHFLVDTGAAVNVLFSESFFSKYRNRARIELSTDNWAGVGKGVEFVRLPSITIMYFDMREKNWKQLFIGDAQVMNFKKEYHMISTSKLSKEGIIKDVVMYEDEGKMNLCDGKELKFYKKSEGRWMF